MKKWIELLKGVDGHEAGKFLEVEEAVARAYVDAGLAKDGGDGPDVVLLQRSIDTFRDELKGFVAETAKAIGEAAEGVKKRPTIQRSADDVEVTADEADKSKSIGDFVRSVYFAISGAATGDIETAKHFHDRLTKDYGQKRTGGDGAALIQRNMTESTGSSLGYTTPVIYETMILKEAAEEQVFLRRARRIPLGARQVEYPALDQYQVPTAGQSAMFGGVKVYRKGENVQRTVSDASTKKIILQAQDLTALFELSRDAMQDSTATLDALVTQLGGEAIGWRTDWEAFQGIGAGQLLGVMNAPCTIPVTRNTSGHIKYQDVFTMYTRLLPRAKAGAAWFVHPFAVSDLLSLQDPSGRFIYLPIISPTGPITAGVTHTLLGLPVVETEKAFPLGTEGDLSLLAMDRYLYGERSGLEVGLSEHFLFDTDQVAIRLKLRNDGKPQLRNPIYLADGSGSNQVSAFVVLN